MNEHSPELDQVREHLEQSAARQSLEFTTGRIVRPPRIFIYGGFGDGKSTLAAGAPNPIFLDLEDGLELIGPPRLPAPATFPVFLRQLRDLLSLEHDRQTVCIDTLDALERLIHAEVCRTHGVATIDLAAGGYGKGYTAAMVGWQSVLELLNALRARGLAIVLIAHSKVEKYESPEHPTFDRHAPALHKSAAALLTAWSDVVGFVTRRVRVEQQDAGFGRERGIAKPVLTAGGDRVIRFGGGPAFMAKSRYAIPAEMPLDWLTFQAALASAMQ